MKSFYSIIRFVNNPLSKENLAIGIIMVSNGKIYYKFSNEKINLVNKINPSNFKLLQYTIQKIKGFVENELTKEVSLFDKEVKVNHEYLTRLSIYNNGFLQFDNPSIIDMDFDQGKFNSFFHRYIDLVIKPVEKKIIDNTFSKKIKRVFSDPLKNHINIDYRVKKSVIPNLFFDYDLDGIGYNGIIYTIKSIDLNAERPIDQVRKDISELESLNQRIDLFGKSKKFDPDKNKHYLVIDKYEGTKERYSELYDILSDQDPEDYKYELISSDKLNDVTKQMLSNNVQEFTDLLV